MGSLRNIWKDKYISQATKVRLVVSLVFSITLYGCETWTIREAERKKIRAFEYWCWRRLLVEAWTEKVTSEEIKSRIGNVMSIETQIIKRRLE